MIPVLKFDKRSKEHQLVVSGKKPLSILLDKGINDDTGIFKSHTTAKRIRAISLDRDDTLPHVKFQNTQQEYDVYSIENDISESIITPCAETKNKTGSDQDKDAYISEIARSCHVQILVTNNERLLAKCVSGEYSTVNYLTAEQVIAYIGFLDRKNGNYSVPGIYDMSANRNMVFLQISYDLIGIGMNKLVQSLSQTQDGSALALRTVSRVSDILKSRDYIHQQILSRQLGENSDDMLYFLDHYLVAAIAAFDALAKITDKIYKPLTKKDKKRFDIKKVSWTNGWATSNDYVTLPPVISFRKHANLYSLINSLRNYIHAEGLQKPAYVFNNGKEKDPMFYIPKDEINDIDSIMKSLDPSSVWIKYSTNGKLSGFDLADFTEKTIRLIIVALRDIMASIEIDHIEDIDLSKIRNEFSGNWPSRTSLDTARLLFGLDIEQT